MIVPDAVYELYTKNASTDWNRAWVGGLGLFIAGSSVGLLGIEAIEYLLRLPGFHPAPLWLILALIGAVLLGAALIIAALRHKSRLLVADTQGLEIRGMLRSVRIPWNEIGAIELHFVLGKPGFYVVMDNTATRGAHWVRHVVPQRRPQTVGAIMVMSEQMAQVVAQRSGKPIREVGR